MSGLYLPDKKDYYIKTRGTSAKTAPKIFSHSASPTTALSGQACRADFISLTKTETSATLSQRQNVIFSLLRQKDGKTLTNVNLKGIIPEGNKLYYEIFKDNDGLSPKC